MKMGENRRSTIPASRRCGLAAGIAFALGALATQGALGDQLFVYEEADGTRWITDRRIHEANFTYKGYYGRPTATRSCHGVTPDTLELRARNFMGTVSEQAERHGLDRLLIKAIITVESCFDTHAVSRVGAEGLMQLMPATASELGVTDSFNAHQNIVGGVRYFAEMLARFDNNPELALAAYNAGPKAVERYGGIPPYRETQGYVEKVLRYYEKYQETEQGKLTSPAQFEPS